LFFSVGADCFVVSFVSFVVEGSILFALSLILLKHSPQHNLFSINVHPFVKSPLHQQHIKQFA